MNSKKVFFGISGLLGLLGVLIIATVVLGNSMLQKKAGELMAKRVDNLTLDEQQTALLQAKKDIQGYEDEEAIARIIVPQEKDQARTVREIINLANTSGIKISSISFPSSNLGQAAPKPTPTTEGDSTTTQPKVETPSETQVKPVDGIKGVYQMEINVQSDTSNPVPYARLIDFLTRLEQNRRTAQVTNITVQPIPKNRGLVTFTLMVNVYIKP